jgi:hypothetical protein
LNLPIGLRQITEFDFDKKSSFLANNTGLIPNQPEVASIGVGAACAAPTPIDATHIKTV